MKSFLYKLSIVCILVGSIFSSSASSFIYDSAEYRDYLQRLGPRDTGGGTYYVLQFRSIINDIEETLIHHREGFKGAIPVDLSINKVRNTKIKIVPCWQCRLEKNGVPSMALNFPSEKSILLDVEEWKRFFRADHKEKRDHTAIVFAYHEYLEAMGGLDEGQNYAYSSKLEKILNDSTRSFYKKFLSPRRNLVTKIRDSYVEVNSSLYEAVETVLGSSYGPNLQSEVFLMNGEFIKVNEDKNNSEWKIVADYLEYQIDDDTMELIVDEASRGEHRNCEFKVKLITTYDVYGPCTTANLVSDVKCEFSKEIQLY